MSFKQIGKFEYFFIIIISIISILIILYIFNDKYINSKKDSLNMGYKEMTIKKIEGGINGREILYLDKSISIGNNINELENGFFDIYIDTTNLKQNKIEIYFNKLWYEEYKGNLLDDYYLGKILKFISETFSIKQMQEENKIFEYIKSEYIKVKQDKLKQLNLKVDALNLNSSCNEGMLRITIVIERNTK